MSELGLQFLSRRIEHLKSGIQLTALMEHFGHRYRLNGNMLCPFHAERTPSSRLYADQNTFWCWVCSPQHGVDIVEYVILALQLEEEIDPERRLAASKRHAIATLHALEYLEETFNLSWASEPWEKRMLEALRANDFPKTPDPQRYWRASHIQVLRVLSSLRNPLKFGVYASHMRKLTISRFDPIAQQRSLWESFRSELSSLL